MFLPLPVARWKPQIPGVLLRSFGEARHHFLRLRPLPGRALASFALPGYGKLHCLHGRLWVTGPGTDDIVLEGGESAEIRGRGQLVIQALLDATLDLEVGRTR